MVSSLGCFENKFRWEYLRTIGSLGVAGLGGVIQNKEGSILISCLGPASSSLINQAELMALNVGLPKVCRQILMVHW